MEPNCEVSWHTYEESPQAWEQVCEEYPVRAGQVITARVMKGLRVVYETVGPCYYPDAADVNERCEQVLSKFPDAGNKSRIDQAISHDTPDPLIPPTPP